MQLLKDVMSYDVHVVSPEATLQQAATQMRDTDCGMLRMCVFTTLNNVSKIQHPANPHEC